MKVKDKPKKINDTTYEINGVEADVEYGDKDKSNFEPKIKIKKLSKEVSIRFKTTEKVKKEKAKDLEIEYDNGMIFRMTPLK